MRRLLALIRHLPPESAFRRHLARFPYQTEETMPAGPARQTSSPETIRRLGGRFIAAPRPAAVRSDA